MKETAKLYNYLYLFETPDTAIIFTDYPFVILNRPNITIATKKFDVVISSSIFIRDKNV